MSILTEENGKFFIEHVGGLNSSGFVLSSNLTEVSLVPMWGGKYFPHHGGQAVPEFPQFTTVEVVDVESVHNVWSTDSTLTKKIFVTVLDGEVVYLARNEKEAFEVRNSNGNGGESPSKLSDLSEDSLVWVLGASAARFKEGCVRSLLGKGRWQGLTFGGSKIQ